MDIVATGMVCSVGLSAVAACAALRSKIARFDELPYFDARGEPIVGAAVPGLDLDLDRGRRLADMLAMALRDCLATVEAASWDRIPLIVGVSEPGRPGENDRISGSIVEDVEARLGLRFDPRHSSAIAKGHTAGYEALRLARSALATSAAPACLVCGVDSYLDPDSLDWLERNWRLKTPDNSDGVIPGEAAACVLVVRPEPDPREGCVARVLGLGFSSEPASVMTEDPLTGVGMARAARAALEDAGLTMEGMDFRLSDVTGESYGFKENALALTRVLRERRPCLPLWHVADSVGDVGAAAGVCQLAFAQSAYRKRYAPGRRAIGFTSAIGGDRAVAVLERQVKPKAGGES